MTSRHDQARKKAAKKDDERVKAAQDALAKKKAIRTKKAWDRRGPEFL